MKMVAFIIISFLALVHQSWGSDHLAKLMKAHPTWSFEVESVDKYIKNELHRSLRSVNSGLNETALRAKINSVFGPDVKHIVTKTDDPKWRKKLPSSFDARDHWKSCKELIGDALDEGPCHTDGPAVVASMMADRLCIHTNGEFQEKLSQEMLAGCGEFCTRNARIFRSLAYATDHGIPTGGSYGSKQGCLPYAHPTCIHNNESFVGDSGLEKVKKCSEILTYDRECPTQCSNSKYKKSLDEDRKKFTTSYRTSNNEFAIRNEILAYGPVVTSIILYDDFLQHPNGMYEKRRDAKFLALDKYFKLIGWGERNGVKYWIGVNTWDHWGESKVFEIRRGVNYAYVEYMSFAGVFEDLD